MGFYEGVKIMYSAAYFLPFWDHSTFSAIYPSDTYQSAFSFLGLGAVLSFGRGHGVLSVAENVVNIQITRHSGHPAIARMSFLEDYPKIRKQERG